MKHIYTIGHSTRTIEEFIEILNHFKVEQLIDVRSFAGSRYCPQFNGQPINKSLTEAGIKYVHTPKVGGKRGKSKTVDPLLNIGWRNAGFKNYADHMQSGEFLEGVAQVEELASERSSAIMCAEAVPWRCHRSLLADALEIRGWEATDIFGLKQHRRHRFTPFAKVDGLVITYPAEVNPNQLCLDIK